MKERTSEQLKGHRIRIEGPQENLMGWNTRITDLETGELIENIDRIELVLVPMEKNYAQLTLVHIVSDREISREQITVENPELDLTAIVEEA